MYLYCFSRKHGNIIEQKHCVPGSAQGGAQNTQHPTGSKQNFDHSESFAAAAADCTAKLQAAGGNCSYCLTNNNASYTYHTRNDDNSGGHWRLNVKWHSHRCARWADNHSRSFAAESNAWKIAHHWQQHYTVGHINGQWQCYYIDTWWSVPATATTTTAATSSHSSDVGRGQAAANVG